jgi:hypothetical protein
LHGHSIRPGSCPIRAFYVATIGAMDDRHAVNGKLRERPSLCLDFNGTGCVVRANETSKLLNLGEIQLIFVCRFARGWSICKI